MPQTISRQKTAIIVFTLPLTLLFVNECNLDVPVNKKNTKKKANKSFVVRTRQQRASIMQVYMSVEHSS